MSVSQRTETTGRVVQTQSMNDTSAATKMERAEAPSAPAVSSLRVLLVEDCPLQQLLTCAALSTWGILPTIAGDGMEAVLLAGEQEFDLLLMDLHMPVMDGLTATARIRQREQRGPRFSRVPIVASTADPADLDRLDWYEAGLDDVLPKPSNLADLRGCLEKWCGRDFASQRIGAPSVGRRR